MQHTFFWTPNICWHSAGSTENAEMKEQLGETGAAVDTWDLVTIPPQGGDSVPEPSHTLGLRKGQILGLLQAVINQTWSEEGMLLSLHTLRWPYQFQILLSKFPPRPGVQSPMASWFAGFLCLGLWGSGKCGGFSPGIPRQEGQQFHLFLFVMHLHSRVFYKSLTFAEFGFLAASLPLPSLPHCRCSGCSCFLFEHWLKLPLLNYFCCQLI